MIQRIQTLYLLAVVALGIALFWLPVVEFVPAANMLHTWQLRPLGFAELMPVGDEALVPAVQGLWGLFVATALIPLLALVDIFLYNKRILQARLNIFTVLLCVGYYGVVAIYVWLVTMVAEVEWFITPWASFPLICMILTIMATRAILKDEALVRAADRLR